MLDADRGQMTGNELHRPFVAHVVKEASNVRIEHPIHTLPLDAHRQRVQRLMWAASGPEPIREAFEVHLINLILWDSFIPYIMPV